MILNLIQFPGLFIHVLYCTISVKHTLPVQWKDEVKAHMEQHKLEEANMTEQPEPIYSLNMHEGEYIRGIITIR